MADQVGNLQQHIFAFAFLAHRNCIDDIWLRAIVILTRIDRADEHRIWY